MNKLIAGREKMDENMYTDDRKYQAKLRMEIILRDHMEELMEFMLWLSEKHDVEWTDENVCEFLKVLQFRQLRLLSEESGEGKEEK